MNQSIKLTPKQNEAILLIIDYMLQFSKSGKYGEMKITFNNREPQNIEISPDKIILTGQKTARAIDISF